MKSSGENATREAERVHTANDGDERRKYVSGFSISFWMAAQHSVRVCGCRKPKKRAAGVISFSFHSLNINENIFAVEVEFLRYSLRLHAVRCCLGSTLKQMKIFHQFFETIQRSFLWFFWVGIWLSCTYRFKFSRSALPHVSVLLIWW